MEYIILDLEWDSAYFKPKKRFINQILQIGAVKLDDNFDKLDTFEVIVCSEITNKVSGRFTRLTGITTEQMRQGVPFSEAVEMYNRFTAGSDVTMTWSDSDLYAILENQDNRLSNDMKFNIGNYIDLQKMVQNEMYKRGYESKNQVSLEYAAEFFGIDTEQYEMHTALDDSRVCASLLKKCYNEVSFKALLRDTDNPEFFGRMRFKPYPISNIRDSNINKKELEFSCPKCNKTAERISAFKYRNRWFCANFVCKDCGFKFNGRVAFKKTYDDLIVKHKICEYKKRKPSNEMQPVPETV